MIIFMVIFGAIYQSNQNVINRTLEQTLFSQQPSGQKNHCITVVISQGNIFTIGMDVYSQSDATQIISTAEKVSNGNFIVNGYYFRVKSMTTALFSKVYAIYDYSLEHNSIVTLALILLGIYVASLGLIAGLGYLLSGNAVKPVKEAFVKQKELVANASHELKTPLTIISTNLAVVMSNENMTVNENKKWLDNIALYVNRMDKLVIDMLELTKLELTKPLSNEQIDLSEMISSYMLSLDAVAYEKKITLNANVKENVNITSDKKSIERLLLILFDNAIKYCNEGGNIWVDLNNNNKKVTISVKNSGKGIEKENVDKVFNRFYRVDNARTSDNGHSFGLGLSIAKALTDNINGTISCQSEVDQYTMFTVVLPQNN